MTHAQARRRIAAGSALVRFFAEDGVHYCLSTGEPVSPGLAAALISELGLERNPDGLFGTRSNQSWRLPQREVTT